MLHGHSKSTVWKIRSLCNCFEGVWSLDTVQTVNNLASGLGRIEVDDVSGAAPRAEGPLAPFMNSTHSMLKVVSLSIPGVAR